MATSDRPREDAPGASDVAGHLREAEFVRLVAEADGDSLAAVGLLARQLDGPYQASVVPSPATANRETGADLTVALGRRTPVADVSVGVAEPASRLAFDVASHLGGADPLLAMAGLVAAGVVPTGAPLKAADRPRRPGLSVPTADPADGVAHTTLVHCAVSGDPAAAETLLSDADADDEAARRQRASLVALRVAEDGTPQAVDAVERFLCPHVGGPFGTVEGYADVLDALSRSRPGLGIALTLGAADREAALEAWRSHGRQVHAATREATTARYDGLFVARIRTGDDRRATPVAAVARLVGQFRSPESVVLAAGDGRAALWADDETDAARVLGRTTDAVGGTAAGTPALGRARIDADATELAAAVREVL